jgi:hypothetical protein
VVFSMHAEAIEPFIHRAGDVQPMKVPAPWISPT